MKRPAKVDFAGPQTASNPGVPPARRLRQGVKKHAHARKTLARRIADEGPGIRETEEARALLEDQLHSLYWWIFNAFKMKGFIRAKALDELQHDAANGTKTRAKHRVLPAEPL